MASKVPSVTSPPWSLATKRIVTLIVLGLLLLVARQVGAITWTAIAIAVLLAYLLAPVVTFFERRLSFIGSYEVRRTLSVVLTWLLVLGVFGLLIGLVVPATLVQLRQLADDLPELVESTQQDMENLLNKPITIGGATVVPWEELSRMLGTGQDDEEGAGLTASLQDTILSLADPALGVLGGAVSILVAAVFALIMLFYLMRDGPLFADYVIGGIPDSYQGDVRRMIHELGQIWNAYLRGQLLLCISVGTATYFAALILGLPQPLVLGLFAGFLEFIPNLGPTLAQIPAVLFALTTSSSTISGLDAGLMYAIIVSLTYIGIQQLEAIFLVPRILGHSLNLHPFVVLVAILIGSNLAGVLGVILAAPMVATIRLFGRYLRGKLLDEELFPALPTVPAQQTSLIFRLMRYWLSKRFPTMPAEVADPPPSDLVPEPGDQRTDVSEWAL